MILGKIRTYFAQLINEVDPDFTEWPRPFDADEIPEALANKVYWLKYDVASTVESGSSYVQDDIDVELKFFFKIFREENDGYDEFMDLVNTIRMKAISITNIEAFKPTDSNPIYRVSAGSQVGEQLLTNDKQLIITLTFSVGINQAIC